MVTAVTKTVGSGGDYATISLGVAALPANLVTADEEWTFKLKNQTFNEQVTLSGHTTDGTHRIILKCDTGASFYDNANKLTNALRYNTANGAAWTGPGTPILTISDNNVVVEGIQISDGGFGLRCIAHSGSATGCVFRDLILETGLSGGNQAVVSCEASTWINVLAIITQDAGSNAYGFSNANTAGSFHNCTAVCLTGTSSSGLGFNRAYCTPLVENCASIGFSGGDFVTGLNAAYNASSDSSASGTNPVINLTPSAQFENYATSNWDMRTKSGSGFINAGIADSAVTLDLDIVRSARSLTTPTIGVWEFSSGASGTLSKANSIAVASISKLDSIAYASIKAANGLTTGN